MSGNVARKRKNQDRTDVVPKRFKTVSEPVSYSSPHINVKCYVSMALLCYLRHGRRNRGPILGACRGQFDTFPVSIVYYIIRVSNVQGAATLIYPVLVAATGIKILIVQNLILIA